MAKFGEKLLLYIHQRVRMRQEEGSAGGANDWKDKACAVGGEAIRLYAALEECEYDYQKNEYAVLGNFGYLKAFPETARPERPIFGIGPDQKKEREP